ncbi:MAG: copper resistance protein NlpE N-terminal domain-containing protein [Phocaeicola sp.]
MKKVILGVFTAVIATSCCSTKGGVEKLEAHTWKLVEMNDAENDAFKAGDGFTITFSTKDSTVAGVGACNRFMGKFEVVDSKGIDIKMGRSTRMACPNLELEQPFFQMLDEADSFEFDDNFTELKLLKNGKECAEFKIFETAPMEDVHNAANSLDYQGVYQGTFPAADCPGININLEIKEENSYEVEYTYMDRDANFEEQGTYSIEGNMLTLNNGKEESYYKVEENRLVKLDANKEPITGETASMYILNKVQ